MRSIFGKLLRIILVINNFALCGFALYAASGYAKTARGCGDTIAADPETAAELRLLSAVWGVLALMNLYFLLKQTHSAISKFWLQVALTVIPIVAAIMIMASSSHIWEGYCF